MGGSLCIEEGEESPERSTTRAVPWLAAWVYSESPLTCVKSVCLDCCRPCRPQQLPMPLAMDGCPIGALPAS